jgi:threonine dehydratase
VETILIPVGGGGLIAGIATAVKSLRPQTSIIGVQAAACASAMAALRLGKPVNIPAKYSIADGISVKEVGQLPFAIIQRLVDDMVSVEEEEIATAMLELLERKKILAEGSGAVPLAALTGKQLSNLGHSFAGKNPSERAIQEPSNHEVLSATEGCPWCPR